MGLEYITRGRNVYLYSFATYSSCAYSRMITTYKIPFIRIMTRYMSEKELIDYRIPIRQLIS